MKTTLRAIQFVLQRTLKANPTLFPVFFTLSLILSLTTILNLFILKSVIDAVGTGTGIFATGVMTLIYIRLALEVINKIVGRSNEYIWFVLDTKNLFSNYDDFLKKLASFDLANFENPTTHDLIWRAFNRFQWHIRYYLDTFVKFVSRLLELSASILVFALASPWSAVAILLTNIFPIYLRFRLGEQNFNIYKADSETVRKYEYLHSMAVNRETLMELKQFQAFGFLKDRLFKLYGSFTGKQLGLYKKQWWWLTLADMLPIIAIFVFLLSITNQLRLGTLSTGSFVFLFTNIFIFSSALNNVSQHLGSLGSDAHFMFDAINFFNVKQDITFPVLEKKEEKALFESLQKPTITLVDVSFKYPNAEKPVLKNLNLTIPFGQNIALIGENGAGKTTLTKLLLRIYDPTSGRIYINGVELSQIPENVLFALYSTLFQSYGKFTLTIRENLELAAGRKLTEDECVDVLKLSNAWNYVKNFSRQLDQQLGPTYKDGVDLSGGQWQQLAIARSLVRNTPILILDEPTSAIDAKAETEIFDRLNKHNKKNTLIFISHRFSTIKDAERIIVLDKGRIIEDGTHSQLMRGDGKYANLYTIQAERYQRE